MKKQVLEQDQMDLVNSLTLRDTLGSSSYRSTREEGGESNYFISHSCHKSLIQWTQWFHKDIMELIQQFKQMAKDMGQPLSMEQEGGWMAQPITSVKLQHNGVDCGAWVLAIIASVLCGYFMTSVSEKEMAQLHTLLHDLIQILSC